MKKTLLLSLTTLLLIFLPVAVFADDGDHSVAQSTDSQIEQQLEEEGLNEPDGPIEIEESQMQGQEATSGYVDENGNPLTQAEYDAYRAETEKGIFEKYPVIGAALGGAAIGAVAWLVINKTNLVKKK